jgi:hypothetical protein
MQDIRIERVQDRKGFKQFVKFPWKIYKDNPYWIPPLISDEMKFLDKQKGIFFHVGEAEYFLAFKGRELVGRISAHIDHHYEKYQDTDTGFFGFFECIEDQDVANALFAQACEWVRSKNKKKILGPNSFTVYDASGMLLRGFDSSPVILLPYNQSYYNDLVTGAGFGKAVDWYAFMVSKNIRIKDTFYKIRDRVNRTANLTIETLDMKRLDYYVGLIGKIFSEAWMENWGHVPLTEYQLEHLVEELRYVVIPELTYIAFLNGKCIGFSLSIKDANPAIKKANGHLFPFGLLKMLLAMRQVKRLRTIAMGVLKEYRHKGLDITFYLNTIENGAKMGFMESECSVIVETNDRMISALEDLNADRYKTYRFYEKNLV